MFVGTQMESSIKKVVEDYNKQRGMGDTSTGSSFTGSSSKNPSAKVCEIILNYLNFWKYYLS